MGESDPRRNRPSNTSQRLGDIDRSAPVSYEDDPDAQASWTQVPPDQEDQEPTTIVGAVAGKSRERAGTVYKDTGSGLTVEVTHANQTRFVVTQTGSDVDIERWELQRHGEFADAPASDLTPSQLEKRPEEEDGLASKNVRNARKKGASTSIGVTAKVRNKT